MIDVAKVKVGVLAPGSAAAATRPLCEEAGLVLVQLLLSVPRLSVPRLFVRAQRQRASSPPNGDAPRGD